MLDEAIKIPASKVEPPNLHKAMDVLVLESEIVKSKCEVGILNV